MNSALAVTFDWYRTLADHRKGVGRGRRFRTYLASTGLKANPWDRNILYSVFDYYADTYIPKSSDHEKNSFWVEFTRILFTKASVDCAPKKIHNHAPAMRDIFGAAGFCLFPDVKPVLSGLKARGLRLSVISNWHRGLNHFCEDLGIGPYFDAIVSSKEVGYAKPDRRIFKEALRRLDVHPEYTVHVGDSVDDDLAGATNAGLKAILLDRDRAHGQISPRIESLSELERLLA